MHKALSKGNITLTQVLMLLQIIKKKKNSFSDLMVICKEGEEQKT